MARRFRTYAAATVIALAALATACSSQASGTPTPQPDNDSSPESPTTTSSPSSHEQEITIDNPLDVSKYLKHSCDVLTDQQVTNGGGDPASGKLDPALKGAGYSSICRWQAADGSSAAFSVGFIVNQKHGISDTKSYHEDAQDLKVFKSTDISGYPAFTTQAKVDVNSGSCTVQVGVNSHIILATLVTYSQKSHPCAGAKHVAKAAVSTLKGGA